ncbi:MAG: Xaa-Pro peptidase family protein [Bacillota bacterium]
MDFLPKEVFTDRHEQIRRYLEREDCAAFVVLTPDNFYYLSGFFLDVAPWERPVALVIPRDKQPFMVMNELSTHHVRMAGERGSLAVEDVYFWREHPSSTDRTYTRPQWTELLGHELKRRDIDRGVLVCDSSFAPLSRLKETVPKIEFASETELLKSMRIIKNEYELNFIREGAKLSDFGQEVFQSLVKPGELMNAVDARTLTQMVTRGAEMFPDCRLECRVFSLTGPDSASPHGTGAGSDATIEAGHGIVNIIIVRLNGYVIENERTWIVGEPTEVQAAAFNAAEKATVAAASKMVAGNRVSEIDAAAQAEIEAAGFGENIRHRTGHGIGIAGHEFPDDVAFNHRPLVAGEVWSAEPGIYIYGVGGFRHDDTVIVGETEPEVVTRWSKNLADQTIKI